MSINKPLPKMPEQFKGKYIDKNYDNLTAPRKWTDDEINYMINLFEKGYSTKEIAKSMDRSITSVKLKKKRLTKQNKTYNSDHYVEKYELNKQFLNIIQPKSILDLYNGGSKQYDDFNVTTNDVNEEFITDYHCDAFNLLCKLYPKKYDVIDLDPFGSAYDCFNLAIKMSKKGLVITLGEMGHKRWKRLDYVSYHYGIHDLNDFTSDNIIKQIQIIGLRNHKQLIPLFKKDWKNISRVWFQIKPYKTIVKGWDLNENK